MSRVKIVPFALEHADPILLDPMFHGMDVGADYLRKQAIDGDAFTGIREDGVIIGAAGITRLWEGVGEAWSYLLPICKAQHKLTLHRGVRNGLEDIAKTRGYHRVQLLTRIDHLAAHAWAISLGFEYEGVLRSYGPAPHKMSFYRFAKLY